MKMKLKVIASLLAVMAIAQTGIRAYAQERQARIGTPALEAKVVQMLQVKAQLEAQGSKLNLDDQAVLAISLKELAGRQSKEMFMSVDHPGI